MNTETGEVFEQNIKLDDYDQYLKDNPHIRRHFSTMHFIDSVSLGIRKPPREFQEEVIGRIKKNNPGHNIQSRWD